MFLSVKKYVSCRKILGTYFYGQKHYFETPRTNIRNSIPPCTLFSSSDLGPHHIYSISLTIVMILILRGVRKFSLPIE